MIEILLNNPRVIHQTADNEIDLPEPTIHLCNDISPILILSQEGRKITINLNTVPELRKAITELVTKLEKKN